MRKTLVLLVTCLLMLSLPVMASLVQDEPVYRPGDGVSLPKAVQEAKPYYTPEAMNERVQGTVWLECVVSREGLPRDIKVTKPLHQQLDAEAMKALELWRFEPGTKDGKPVAVRIAVEMTFTLK
jgi:periplasmic protein TonB